MVVAHSQEFDDKDGRVPRAEVVQHFADYAGVSVGVVLVTPEIATEWLRGNVHNRVMRPTVLRVLQGAMERNEFVLNGESIIFSDDGVLLDGQFRLTSIAQSGKAVWSVVVWGIRQSTQYTIDTNLPRTVADVLALERPATKDVSAVLTQLWYFETHGFMGGGPGGSLITRPTRTQILKVFDEHPNVERSLPVGVRLKHLIPTRSITSAIHYVLSDIDKDTATEFFDRIADGSGLTRGHPALTLRDTLSRDMAARQRMSSRRRAALVIRAWNAFRDNETLTKFVWTSDQTFPQPV